MTPAGRRLVLVFLLLTSASALAQKTAPARLATPAYVGITEGPQAFSLYVRAGGRQIRTTVAKRANLGASLARLATTHNLKIVSASIRGPSNTPALRSQLWLKHDIWAAGKVKGNTDEELAAEAEQHFEFGHSANVEIDQERRVHVKDRAVTLADYRRITSPALYQRVWKGLDWARRQNLDIVVVGSTARGGGVARMRHPMVGMLQQNDVPVTWLAMPPDERIFTITKKKLHNAFQDVGADDDHLSARDVADLRAWTDRAMATFPKDVFASRPDRTKVVIIDDYQPSGLIPLIRRQNPQAIILFRTHTQIRSDLAAQPGTRTAAAWDYVRENAKGADRVIFHPIPDNVPRDIEDAWNPRIARMRATGDPLDGLYKPLTPAQRRYFRGRLDGLLVEQGQTPLDPNRPFMHQNARFDPSKGIHDVITSYGLMRARLVKEGKPVPQLVLAGFGSVDDIEGNEIYKDTRDFLQQPENRGFAHDVKVVRLDSEDQLMNFVRKESKVALQLSRGRALKGA
jgi:hypothetical protein